MKVAPSFDNVFRQATSGSSLRVYLLVTGVLSALVQVLAVIFMKEKPIPGGVSGEYVAGKIDKYGLYLYLAIAGFFIIIYYLMTQVIGGTVVSAVSMSGMFFVILINFIAVAIILSVLQKKADELKKDIKPTNQDLIKMKQENLNFSDALTHKSYVMVFLGAVFILGPGTFINFNSFNILFAIGAMPSGTAVALYWLCDMMGRFLGGIGGYFLIDHLHF